MRSQTYGLLGMALMFATEMKVGKAMKEQDLRERWKNLQNLPRKKKKEKEHILLIWSILQYDPFHLNDFSLF